MTTWRGSTSPERAAPSGFHSMGQRARTDAPGAATPAALSSENYSFFRLLWVGPLISIRALEIGALQEAVVDENL